MEPITSGGLLVAAGAIATKSIEWFIARQNFYSASKEAIAQEAMAKAQQDASDIEHIKSNYERIKLLENRLDQLDEEREALRKDNAMMTDDLRKTREELRMVQTQLTQMSADLLAANSTRKELQNKIEDLMLQLKVNQDIETHKEIHNG